MLPADSRAQRADSPFLTVERVAGDAARVARLAELAAEAGISLTQLALRWLLSKPAVTSVLIGARNVRQLRDCAAAAGQEALPDDLLTALDLATA